MEKNKENNQFMTKETQGMYLLQCGIEALIDYLDNGETAKNEERQPQSIDIVQQKLRDYNSKMKPSEASSSIKQTK